MKKTPKSVQAQLSALNNLPYSKIDFSDIPATSESDWKGAKRGAFYRPVKQQITLRLDADIIAWFKSHPMEDKGYQTSINNALREYVVKHNG